MEVKITRERPHLFAPGINITAAAVIAGDITSQALESAIFNALRNNEILCCRIRLDENGDAYYQPAREPVFNIRETPDRWSDIFHEQQRIPFDLENGELIRFFIRKMGDTWDLMVFAHHLAGDGLSLAYFIADVMDALAGRPLKFKQLQLFSQTSLPSGSQLNPRLQILVNGLNERWRTTGRTFSFDDYRRLFSRYWAGRETAVYFEEIRGKELIALARAARQNGLTLNSVLLTALLRAAGETTDVGLSASIRPPEFRGMGNYATGISVQYRYDESADFWSNTRAVQQQIYSKLENPAEKYYLLQFVGALAPTLIDATYFAAFDGFDNKSAITLRNVFGYDGKPVGISMTNLTRLDIQQQFGEIRLETLFFIPPLAPNARRVFGISTLGDRMSIALHIEKSERLEEDVAMFRRAAAILKALEDPEAR